jgi:HEAT repeat protein
VHHPDNGVRNAARQLLEGYGTKADPLLGQSLGDLVAENAQVRRAAADWLGQQAVVKERRGEVATALVAVLKDRDDLVSQSALVALKVWATKANSPAIVKLTNDKGFNPHANFMRNTALEVLGHIKDEKAVEVIVPHLANVFDRDAAKKGLIAMGSVGEKPLLKYLTNQDPQVRRQICEVLAEIGTKDSVKPLQSAYRDPDPFVRLEAVKAVQAITKR